GAHRLVTLTGAGDVGRTRFRRSRPGPGDCRGRAGPPARFRHGDHRPYRSCGGSRGKGIKWRQFPAVALRTRRVDLVLLGVMMPELNGYEVLRRLKADPRLLDIPVLMVSALDEIDSVVRCIERGAEDCHKPLDPV